MSLKKICLLALSVVLLNGCAVFQLKDIPTVTLPPAKHGELKPSVGFSLQAKSTMCSTADYPEKAQRKLQDELATTLRQTDYFSSVTPNSRNTDIFLDVRLHDSGSPAAMVGAFITGYTFGIIPSWATINQEITIQSVQPPSSKIYRSEDRARMVMWLPMIFVFPFYNFSEATEMQQNMYRDIIRQMQEDRILVKQIHPAPPAEAPAVNTTAEGAVP